MRSDGAPKASQRVVTKSTRRDRHRILANSCAFA